MNRCSSYIVLCVAILATTTCVPTQTDQDPTGSRRPGDGDRCPVCGMFVSPFPQWLAQVVHEDGTTSFFDGAKDMFRYLHERGKYLPEKQRVGVTSVFVTDYYTTRSIPARDAFFVVGSDVHGPMGPELVAHMTRDDAEEFRLDHGAHVIVSFEDVTTALLESL